MSILFPGSFQGSGVLVRNRSIAQQAPAATTATFITGSQLKAPPGGFKVGQKLRWTFNMAKTAAGTATSTLSIVFGTAGTVADTARVSFTKPAGTAAADEGYCIVEAVIRSVSATGVVVGEFVLLHNLAATGHAQIPCVVVNTISAGFDNTAEELYAGLVITTGASDVITIEMVNAELIGANG